MIAASVSAENVQVLNLVQALLGNVTANLRAVGLTCHGEGVALHFVLEREDAADREEIEEIAFEFEALQTSAVDVEVVVTVDQRPLPELDLPRRMVFARKE